MNTNNPLSKILVVLAIFAMLFGLVGVSNVAAQSSAPTVATYAELPLKGQLIIPPGAEFVVPAEWHGLPVTIHRGMADPSVGSVIEYGYSIASDRVERYGPGPYVTAIWDAVANPLPGFTGRTSCDTEYRLDGVALGKGTSIGDSGCFEMIEYDQSQQPVSQESLAAQNALESEPTVIPPAVVDTPAVPASTPVGAYVPNNGSPVQVLVDPNLMAFAVMMGWLFLICGVPFLVLALLVYALVRALRKPKTTTVVKE